MFQIHITTVLKFNGETMMTSITMAIMTPIVLGLLAAIAYDDMRD